MGRIAFVPVGSVPRDLVGRIAAETCEILGAQRAADQCGAAIPEPVPDPQRGRVLARGILARLRAPAGVSASRVLAITQSDLYAPGLNFVFGEADPSGKCAVISLARLRPTGHEPEARERLVLARAVKEAVHELGHTFGLAHCASPTCVMYFSNTLADTDRKDKRPCRECQARLMALAP